VLYAPEGAADAGDADVVVTSFAELGARAGLPDPPSKK